MQGNRSGAAQCRNTNAAPDHHQRKALKMAIETVNQPKGAAQLVTAQHSFHPYGEGDLFEVKAGVSAEDALNSAACLLDVAEDVAKSIAMGTYDEDGRVAAQHAWAIVSLINMGNAILYGLSTSVVKENRQG
jgi:predicted N-formylglutamate amidohydrolase